MIFRPIAEMRRVHRDAAWVVVAVILAGAWYPLLPNVYPDTGRFREAGLLSLLALPPVIAPSAAAAVEVCAEHVRRVGLQTARDTGRHAVLRGGRSELVKQA